MSEQDEREKAEFRARIAGDMVACGDCDGRGHIVVPDHGGDGPERERPCSKCEGTGRVKRFSEALREECKGFYYRHTGRSCNKCQGRGWIEPENFFALLLVELPEVGIDYSIMPSVVEVWEWGQPRTRDGDGDDPEFRLYRAVLAVLEAAP